MRDELLFREIGRLEGRLHYSPMRLPWMIRMRIRGIMHAAENAGIPVHEDDLGLWIAGKILPPRYREGINDPIRVSTIAHFYLSSVNAKTSTENGCAAATLDAVFDHRKAVLEWSPDELKAILPYWQSLVTSDRLKQVSATIEGVASSVSAMLHSINRLEREELQLEPKLPNPEWIRSMPLSWLASIRVPQLLYHSGVIGCVFPNIVPAIRFIDMTEDHINVAIKKRLRQEIVIGHQQLDSLELAKVALVNRTRGTKRSRFDAAADILSALPHIRRDKLASTLGITPQGAGYLIKKMADFRLPVASSGRVIGVL